MTADDPVVVRIGGADYVVPPMPFYALKRAWPHIQHLSELGQLMQAVVVARAYLNVAEDAERPARQATYDAAMGKAVAAGADFVGQTDAALAIIAAALSLTHPELNAEDLSKLLKPEEYSGLHGAVKTLLSTSGLATGELTATSPIPAATSTGTDTSPNSSPAA
jgi:hypothetical protein